MAVTAGRGLVGAATVVVAAAVEAEGGVIDLFAGLLEYICGILMLLTPRRTVLKGDGSGEVGIEIYVSSSSLILG